MQKKLITRINGIILSILTFIIILTLASCTKPRGNISGTVDQESCKHSFSEWKEITPATCTQNGKQTRTCSKCKFKETEPTDKTTHPAKITSVTPPTCTSEGYSVYLCECGYTYKSDYVIPTGHSLKKTATVAKSCAEPGYTTYDCEHCEYAFKSDFVAQSHDFVTSVTMPTATQSGFSTHTCTECSYHYDNNFVKYTDILPSPYLDDCPPLYRGIDIYDMEHEMINGKYQPIDWAKVKAQGYDFVILKVGSDYSGKSKTFDMDYEGAKAAGLMVGAYYYAYSSTVSGTRNDAQEVLEWIKGKQFEFPIYYDIEEAYLAENLSRDSLTEIITVFIEELQINGYYSALYVNNNWLRNILDTETILKRFDIWFARPFNVDNPTWDKETYGNQLSMWQYSHVGNVDGFKTEIDLNFCYRDYPTIMKQWGLNGFQKESGEPKK